VKKFLSRSAAYLPAVLVTGHNGENPDEVMNHNLPAFQLDELANELLQ
jgi:hypothetical protein